MELWSPPAAAALTSLAVRIVSILLLFLAQILLTRTLGPVEFGVFALALAWAKGLGIAATLGTEALIVRDVSAHLVHGQSGAIRRLVRWAGRTFATSTTATALAAAFAFAWAAGDEPWLVAAWIALALLPLSAAMRLAQHVLAGLRQPILAQLPETIVQPLLFLLAAASVAAAGALTANGAMLLQVAAAAVGAVLALALLIRALPRGTSAEPAADGSGRWRSASALFLATGAASLTAAMPVLLLGIMSGPAEAGLMAVARSLADLTLVPILAFGAVMRPRLARAWAEGDRSAVQRGYTAFARASSALVVPLALALLVVRQPLLGIFGEHFIAAAPALAILLAGQIAGAMAGSNALLLATAGHERTVAAVSVAALLLGTLATALLIEAQGVAGAAMGAAGTAILWNAALAQRTRALTGLRPGVF